MKTIILAILTMSPLLGFAQSVSCRPHGEAFYTKLEIYKPDDSINVPWFMARLDNQHRQRKVFTVESTSRGNKLLFFSKGGKKEFTLDFGPYRGPGVYHSVKLILNQGEHNEEKASLMCDQVGDLGYTNQCKVENPNVSFFQAIQTRNLDLVEAHLECGLNANIKNEFGCTPLLVLGDSACGQSLENHLPYMPMIQAFPIADLLTNSGATLEAKDPANAERALHKFAKLSELEVVSLLLDLEADVDAQDSTGFTPLMRAVERNNKYLVQRIVEAGPDLNLKNKSNETALAIAQRLELKKLLPLLQAPTSIVDIEGQVDGTCTPNKIRVKANEVSKFTLKATADEMFLFEVPGLSISLMADADSAVSQNFLPTRKGTFEFTCGVHGAQIQTTGQIVIE